MTARSITLYATGIWSNVEIMWEHPLWARFLERLASFARLVLLDMRGEDAGERDLKGVPDRWHPYRVVG